MTHPRSSAAIVSVVVAADLAVLLLLVGAHFVNHATIGSRLLDMDRESNIPTWFASTNFAMAALVCALAVAGARGRARTAWAGIAVIMLAFSLDEAASMHEMAGRRLGQGATLGLTQPIAALVVLAVLLAASRAVRRGGIFLGVAAMVLLLSQFCASVAGLFLEGYAHFAVGAVEDATEALTGILVLAAALSAVVAPVDLRPVALRASWVDLYRRFAAAR